MQNRLENNPEFDLSRPATPLAGGSPAPGTLSRSPDPQAPNAQTGSARQPSRGSIEVGVKMALGLKS